MAERPPGTHPPRRRRPVKRAPPIVERTDEGLPRTHRVRRQREIKKVQDTGLKIAAGPLLLLLLPNTLGARRLGVTVSSKVGNSVVRSKVKRRFRELFRHKRGQLPPSVDLVLIARSSAKDADYATLSREFDKAATEARRRMAPKPRS